MPLISCPACGRQVSDQARACIHCGRSPAPPAPPSTDGNLRNQAITQLRRQILEEQAIPVYSLTLVRAGLASVGAIGGLGVIGGVIGIASGAVPTAAAFIVAVSSASICLGCLVISEALSIGAAILRELRVQRLLLSRLVNGRPSYHAVEDYMEQSQR